MAFHLSTSIRDPGRIGATCSETVVVTDRGCEVLSNVPRVLFRRDYRQVKLYASGCGDAYPYWALPRFVKKE